jgi:hypothetical protein
MKRLILAATVIGLAGAGIVGWKVVGQASERTRTVNGVRIDPDTMLLVPSGVRVKVEVLNASGQRGLARRAMSYLRERGFDVVNMGNAAAPRDSSIVYDRSGHPEWAALAVRALGQARSETRLDEARYLDLTIVLGANFRTPAQIFYP